MTAHVADRSPGARKVLKSEREVERVSPGVADHIALGVAAGAGLMAAHMVGDSWCIIDEAQENKYRMTRHRERCRVYRPAFINFLK